MGEYANVNGINQYYEIHGTGSPMILLHGGLGSGEMFGPILDTFAERHRVIVPDLQGHGRTADIDRPLDVRLMAGDIAALIDHLGLDRPDVVGYSLGAGVALHVAIAYPEKVGRLVAASAQVSRSAIYPEILAQQGQMGAAAAEFLKETPMYELYQRVAPRPEDFGRLLDKIGTFMATGANLESRFAELQVPTLLVSGDADMFPPAYAARQFELLGGGLRDGGWMGDGRAEGGHALAILPRQTHYSIFRSPLLAAAALAFLDEETG